MSPIGHDAGLNGPENDAAQPAPAPRITLFDELREGKAALRAQSASHGPERVSARPNARGGAVGTPHSRFLGDLIDVDMLHPNKRTLVQNILDPLAQRLVDNEADELLRVSGVSVVLLTAAEVLNAPELMDAMRSSWNGAMGLDERIATTLNQTLKIQKERNRSVELLLKLEKHRTSRSGGAAPGGGL